MQYAIVKKLKINGKRRMGISKGWKMGSIMLLTVSEIHEIFLNLLKKSFTEDWGSRSSVVLNICCRVE